MIPLWDGMWEERWSISPMTVLVRLDIVVLSSRSSGGKVTFHQELVIVSNIVIGWGFVISKIFKACQGRGLSQCGQINQAILTLSWLMYVTLPLPCCFPAQFKQVASLSLADTSCRSWWLYQRLPRTLQVHERTWCQWWTMAPRCINSIFRLAVHVCWWTGCLLNKFWNWTWTSQVWFLTLQVQYDCHEWM